MLNTRALRVAALPVAVAAVLGIAACGGDDGDSEEEAIALTEWVTQADEICAESNAQLQEDATAFIQESGGQPTGEDAEVLVSDYLVPAYREQADEIRDLPPPDEQADTVDELVDALDEGIETIENDPAAVLEDETPAGFSEANELAAELGLEECGE